MTDVKDDKKVALSVGAYFDEPGNMVPAPVGAVIVWTVDEAGAEFGTLTDNGDGTATLAATGVLGPAQVHVEISAPGIATITGDEMYMFVPGDAARASIATGPEEEVTPD